jgi:hypothetical protein
MWIHANLKIRRDHRLFIRQQSDRAMPQPVHVDDPRARDHHHDQRSGQNHRRAPHTSDNQGNGRADRRCPNAGRGAVGSNPRGSPTSGSKRHHSQIWPMPGYGSLRDGLTIPPVLIDKLIDSGARSFQMSP